MPTPKKTPSTRPRKAPPTDQEVNALMPVPTLPPQGFEWPVDASHRRVWMPVPGSPVEGLEVAHTGDVRINPSLPTNLSYEWLNKFSVYSGTYQTFMSIGGKYVERWMCVWAAIHNYPLMKIAESGLAVERENAAAHDRWSNLLCLVEPPAKAEETGLGKDSNHPSLCSNHAHRDAYRNKVDGGRIKTGVYCLIPNGIGIEQVFKKSTGQVTSVSYKPATGRTTIERN